MKTAGKPLFVERLTGWIGSIPSLIVHTFIFIGAFIAGVLGFESWELILLVLTTIVSLEAIYLAIFIQMTVNRNTESLKEVEEDIDEIQEDVEELSEDLDEIQEDIEEIQEDEDADDTRKAAQKVALEQLTNDVRRILQDLEALKHKP